MPFGNDENVPISAESVKQGLAEVSARDKIWDVHKAQSDDVKGVYETVSEFERYALRIGNCSGILRFGRVVDTETGELLFRLRHAQFCRVRHCPVCQWRRALMWQARFYEALPTIQAAYPKARWLLLTLTVRNCAVDELGETLGAMNAAWRRLTLRKEFKPVKGWVRTTEVTRGADGSAHPHFHALLMVQSSFFKGSAYVKHSRWVELWQECARLDYAPNVDVRAVKAKRGQDEAAALSGAVAETLKYAVKPADMVADAEWFLEMTRQLHKKRFVATGGALKDVFRLGEETEQDLLLEGQENASTGQEELLMAFGWEREEKRYTRKPEADKLGD